MENEQEFFITREDAANILAVNIRQVDSLIRAGKLRAKNISAGDTRKHWRVLKEDVMSFDNVRN